MDAGGLLEYYREQEPAWAQIPAEGHNPKVAKGAISQSCEALHPAPSLHSREGRAMTWPAAVGRVGWTPRQDSNLQPTD